MDMSTMFTMLDGMLAHASHEALTVVTLSTGGIVAWAFLWGLPIARRLFRQCLRMFAVRRSRHGAHGRGHSSQSGGASSSTCTPKREQKSVTSWYSNATAAGISLSWSGLNETLCSQWKRTQAPDVAAVSGTATGCGDVSVRYTNRGQRLESLTSLGAGREN